MNAVMKDEVRVQVNVGQLIRNSRFAFTNRATLIRELLQNGRRAGATRIDILTPDFETLVVIDNGCGINDMQSLLTIAESGWNKDTRDAESPYGMGWLTTLYFADHIRVQSGNRVLSAATADLLDLKAVNIEIVDTTIKGTRIEARGGQVSAIIKSGLMDDPMKREVEGFAIPVTLNGDEYARPFAVDETFTPCAVGEFKFDMNSLFATISLKIFLQGICVLTKGTAYRPNVIVHLDRTFKGRMPDRDKLVEEDDAWSRIKGVIQHELRKVMMLQKEKLGSEAFLIRFGDMCLNEHMADLLNDIDAAKANWFVNISDDPTASSESHYKLHTESGLVSRAEVTTKGVMSVDGSNEYDGFIPTIFAKVNNMFAADTDIHSNLGRLDQGHWIQSVITRPDRDEFSLEIVGEKGRLHGWLANENVEVIACAGYRLRHTVLGTVEVAGEGLFTGTGDYHEDDEVERDDAGHAGNRIPCLQIVMPTPDTSVCMQVSDFRVDDAYDEEWERSTHARLRTLHAEATNADPATIFRTELEGANLYHCDSAACRGKSFVVTYTEEGKLASVTLQDVK